MVNFELIFTYTVRYESKFCQGDIWMSDCYSTICSKDYLFLLNCLCTFVESQLTMYMWIYFVTLLFSFKKKEEEVVKASTFWMIPKLTCAGWTPVSLAKAKRTELKFQGLPTIGETGFEKVSSAKLMSY